MRKAALSDVHMGGGGSADSCNRVGLLNLITAILRYDPHKIILVGDILERWQFSLDEIITFNKDLFDKINTLLVNAWQIPDIELIEGNHDADVFGNAVALQKVLPGVSVTPHPNTFDCDDWRFLHGYQFDPLNDKGWFRPVAHGLTYFAGILERVTGIDDYYLNPVNLISPAKRPNASIHGDIQEGVENYAKETGKKICYGHTHQHDISKDMSIANCGCVCGDKADAVIIFDDGLVNSIHAGE